MKELVLTELERYLAKAITKTPAPGKQCARSAIRHIQKAWKLLSLDPEMAVFRSITAEEESASAIFHSLRRRGYKHSASLNPTAHLQKNALSPFFNAIETVLAQAPTPKDLQLVHSKSENRLRVRYKSVNPKTGEECYAFPVPPLGFNIRRDGMIYEFKEELEHIANIKKHSSILKHLKKRANQRNQILYAASHGVPSFAGSVEKYFEAFRQNMFRNLIVFLLIDDYPEKQHFVQQALNAFLKMLEKLPTDIVFD